jgi:hypothetical protein
MIPQACPNFTLASNLRATIQPWLPQCRKFVHAVNSLPSLAEGGSVRVGGEDVRSLQLDSLRRALGEVPQVGG